VKAFGIFLWRITASHIISYFIAGVLAYYFLNYHELLHTPPFSYFMKPMDATSVQIGPSLQFIRGFIFSTALWPFRDVFLKTKSGWLKLWMLLLGLCILSTSAAAPGSVEGFIYTNIPFEKQVVGYFEVMPQTLLFSLMIFFWYKKPVRTWNIVSIVLLVIIFAFGVIALIRPAH
jgi:hypothetical protein